LVSNLYKSQQHLNKSKHLFIVSYSFVNKIFEVENTGFEKLATQLFAYQYKENKVYNEWCNCLHADKRAITAMKQIPFLPISFFKTHKIICGDEQYDVVFESSGTTQSFKSRHYVKDIGLYIQSFTKGFQIFYGDIKEWCIIGYCRLISSKKTHLW
jgi:hypothetical protein